MGRYLFGISKYCEDVLQSGIITINEIDGLFDNDVMKTGKVKYGLCIEKPRYIEGTEVLITILKKKYRIEAVRQLLELGYSRLTLICRTDKGYDRQSFDFGKYCKVRVDDCLVVLYLQNRSYSGISAIEYMARNYRDVLPSGFRVVTVTEQAEPAEYYYYTAMASYFITERDRAETCGKTVQLWHGFPLKALGHMMKSYRPEGNKTSNAWAKCDYIASYGQMYTNLMCACWGTPAVQYWDVGMPRNDLLFLADGKKNLYEILPDCVGRKIVFYVPTFRELERKDTLEIQVDGDDNGYFFYWKDFDIGRLERFCRQNNLYFVFKLHPEDASKVKTWYAKSEYIGIMADEMLGDKCLYEYLNAADVLITDYSSVYFDYLLLDRPIVFTDRDVDLYGARRGIILEPLDFWRPGAVVHTMELLERELSNVFSGIDAYKEKRKCLLPLVHRYRDGQSTKRLFNMLKNNLDGMQGREKEPV